MSMSRVHLLRTLSAAALSAAAASASATTAPASIQGGGATAAQGNYAGPNNASTGAPQSELSTFNAAQSVVAFSTYWGAGSGAGQNAFLNDDLTCDINKVNNLNGQKCSGTVPGTTNYVDYAFSEAVLNATQIAAWSSSSYGQAVSGNLIQLPLHGTGEAIPVVDSNITANGKLELSDNDLCEIFSGGYTNWNQITDSKTLKPAAGAFQVVYRSDSSGSTYILTQHLAAVCTAANTNAGVTFTATTTFATIFGGTASDVTSFIPNAVPESGSQAVAQQLVNDQQATTPIPAIGYLSPDWTSVPPASDSLLANGQTSPLFVAAIFNGTKAYTPTQANIEAGLDYVTQVAQGSPTAAPTTAAAGELPQSWVPIVQKTSRGYPIVGYGTVDLAQCYANPAVGAAFISYLTKHYSNATYTAIQTNNGLAGIANKGSSIFLKEIQAHILTNEKNQAGPWYTDIQDTKVCATVPGR
jgi:ABC-type phosphate transport system substrate-binding protein